MIQDKIKNKKGFALMLTLIVLSVVIAVTLSLVELSIKKLQLSIDTRDSEQVFHAATTAMECGMYLRNRNPDAFIDWTAGRSSAPRLNCFGLNLLPDTVQDRSGNNSIGLYSRFNYSIPNVNIGGNEPNYLYIEVHILNAQTLTGASMSRSGISSLGPVTCARGSVCTVVIARAYNRATAPVSGGGPEIMRELSAIF